VNLYRPFTSQVKAIRQVPILSDSSIDTFKSQAFEPALPAILPHGCFKEYQAIHHWFKLPSPGKWMVNEPYLRPYRDTMVPLEFTKPDGSFQRLHAPLSLFLEYCASPSFFEAFGRLYLAQVQLLDLPAELGANFPIPIHVNQAGKGDVYDTNIWIGAAPTYTPLHRDPNPNLFMQLAGSKTVRLFRPEVGTQIFQDVKTRVGGCKSATFRGEEMMQGEERKLLEDMVWTDNNVASKGQEARLESGDAIFIPMGWWHSIRGVGNGITGSVGDNVPFLV
jgi:hypothetical protein